MTRQRRWQLTCKALGLCTICAHPAVCPNLCGPCREKNRECSRTNYRKKHGIPLTAPLGNQGRPRHP